MVGELFEMLSGTPWFLAAEKAQPLIQRLDPATRAKVLAALAALVILGFAMVLLAWLAGRATRRYINRKPILSKRNLAAQQDDWASKPLVPRDE